MAIGPDSRRRTICEKSNQKRNKGESAGEKETTNQEMTVPTCGPYKYATCKLRRVPNSRRRRRCDRTELPTAENRQIWN